MNSNVRNGTNKVERVVIQELGYAMMTAQKKPQTASSTRERRSSFSLAIFSIQKILIVPTIVVGFVLILWGRRGRSTQK